MYCCLQSCEPIDGLASLLKLSNKKCADLAKIDDLEVI